jgi:hypothetical protein
MSISNWIPEIMYEESEEGQSNIPFIMVPKNEVMPKLLYMFESRDTGKKEPGLEGEEVPVFEWDLHQYADMAILKAGLNIDVYDQVRECLGLEPLLIAAEKGAKIGNKVKQNLDK